VHGALADVTDTMNNIDRNMGDTANQIAADFFRSRDHIIEYVTRNADRAAADGANGSHGTRCGTAYPGNRCAGRAFRAADDARHAFLRSSHAFRSTHAFRRRSRCTLRR
jgi:hypothetical protein